MKVFQIRGDSRYFGSRFKDQSDFDVLREAELANRMFIIDKQLQVEYYFETPANEGVITDCPGFNIECALILSERVTQVLTPELSRAGRLFPTTLTLAGIHRKPPPAPEQPYHLFFCDQRLDAIDHDRIEFWEFDGQPVPWKPSRWVFRPEALEGVGFFRLVNLPNRLFATERVMNLVEQHAVTGLWVQPLWSSDAGPLATFDDIGPIDRAIRDAEAVTREKRATMRDFIAQTR